jgi:hypothetical protein
MSRRHIRHTTLVLTKSEEELREILAQAPPSPEQIALDESIDPLVDMEGGRKELRRMAELEL